MSLAAVGRLVRKGRSISGAVLAPFMQASSSLILQFVALRRMGADGFGVYALLYSGLVVLTAVSSGLVGDSLTVLDRRRPEVRAGLVRTALATTALATVVGTVAARASGGQVSWPVALLFGAGIAAFLLEDLVRRLLMACLLFWRVVAVDACVLAVTVWMLAVPAVVGGGRLDLDVLFLVVAVAQAAGLLVGWALLPAEERRRTPGGGADVATVVRFGAWRATQQMIRPASMMGFRLLVVLAVGTATFGELEAARVYTAPAMLLVSGLSHFYLASQSAQSGRSLTAVLRRADRGLVSLVACMVGISAVALVAAPLVGDTFTGGDFDLDLVAVAGWMLYAGATAVWAPYGSLASVRGDHAFVVAMRTADAVVSLVAVAGLVLVVGIPVAAAPFALAVGSFVAVPLIRRRLLARARTAPTTEPAPATAPADAGRTPVPVP